MQCSDDVYAKAWEAITNEEFIDQSATEPYWVEESDDTGEPRNVYGFGDTCPLAASCQSFKNKKNCCKSMVCEEFAQNYLAKHAWESSNHPETQHKKKEALDAAEKIPVQITERRNSGFLRLAVQKLSIERPPLL